MLAARDDDDVGARQRRSRLAQASRRKQVAAAKGIGGVDQDNIHVARKLPMLKAIVKNEPLHSLLSKLAAVSEAVGADAESDAVRQARFEQLDFVARRFWRGSRILVSCGLSQACRDSRV